MPAPYQPLVLTSRNLESFDLSVMATELMNDEVFHKSGRLARTLAHGEQMTAVLTVLKKHSEMHEHSSPGPVTVTVLSGNVVFSFGPPRGDVSLSAGAAVIFSKDATHRVRAEQDSALLLVIGGRA